MWLCSCKHAIYPRHYAHCASKDFSRHPALLENWRLFSSTFSQDEVAWFQDIRSRFPITLIRIIFSQSLTTSRSNVSKQFSFMWWGFKLVELDIYVYCFSSLCANKDIKGPIMMSHMLTENSCPWVMRLCWAGLDTAVTVQLWWLIFDTVRPRAPLLSDPHCVHST